MNDINFQRSLLDMRFFPLAFCVTLALWAQPPVGRLEGVVEDPSGLAIIGAQLIAENQQTGFRTPSLSDGRGLYAFASLPPGNYTLTVQTPGFRTARLTGLVVSPSITVTASIRLELGAMTETVNVVAKETTVQLADAQGGGAIAQHDIQVLPQQERNPIKLAILQPGVQVFPGMIGISPVNGSRVGSNEVKLDGLDVNEPM